MDCQEVLSARIDEAPLQSALISFSDHNKLGVNGRPHLTLSFTLLSWIDLVCAAESMIQRLEKLGFCRGDRVVHTYGNRTEGLVVAIASLIAGTVEVPLDPTTPANEIISVAKRVKGRWLEADGTTLAMRSNETLLRSFRRRLQPREYAHPALILFTSGTTGEPQGVVLSQKNLICNANAKLAAAPQTRDDVRLTVLPIWHAYARTCDVMTWLISGCTLAIDLGWEGFQRLAPAVAPTLLNTVPSLAYRLVENEFQRHAPRSKAVSRLRMLGCGGAALAASAFDALTSQGVTVIQGYGLTEASPVVCSATPDNARAGHVGRPVDGCETRVDKNGQLWVRGDGVMVGYWDNEEATSKKIVNGWLDTGDCVEVDPVDGQFRILGRVDDRITLSNGRKVFPLPIEQRVQRIAGVRHAMVVPHDRHLCVYIDAENPLAHEQTVWQGMVMNAVADLPDWQRPRNVIFFPQPLADCRDLLTSKGTLRRHLIAKAFQFAL